MKKVKILLTLLLISSIMCLNGCGGKLRTPPWKEREIDQMKYDEQKTVVVMHYKF